jgi:hypothetical protein
MFGLAVNWWPSIHLRFSDNDSVQTFDSRDYLVLDSSDEYIDLYHFAELVASNVSSPTVQSAAQNVMSAIANCVIA